MNSKESALYSKCRRAQKMIIDEFYEKFSFSKHERVLDVGCGSGDFTFDISKNVRSVVGIDVSKDMIEYAQRHNQASNVEYIVCDAQNFGAHLDVWKENQFDKVVAMNVLHWVKDREKVIENINACLKPGGELFIVVSGQMNKVDGNNTNELPWYMKNHPKWKNFLKNYEYSMYTDLTIPDWSHLLENNGLSLVCNEVKFPCDDIHAILNDNELKGYIKTLLGHFAYVPEERHSEFLEDAVDWCKRELPLNNEGLMYVEAEMYFIQAVKKYRNQPNAINYKLVMNAVSNAH